MLKYKMLKNNILKHLTINNNIEMSKVKVYNPNYNMSCNVAPLCKMDKKWKTSHIRTMSYQLEQLILSSRDDDELDGILKAFEEVKNNVNETIKQKTIRLILKLKYMRMKN